MGPTLAGRIWDSHKLAETDGECLVYVDFHLIHDATSSQAFSFLRSRGLSVRRPDLAIATMDHTVSTADPLPRPVGIVGRQLAALESNCREFGITLLGLDSPDRGIVHVVGPELGLTQPGMVIACGDSHTSTHGAFGALALSIGTSEIAQVLAGQCLVDSPPGSMAITVDGTLNPGVSAKDLALAIINRIGVSGGRGLVVHFNGTTVAGLTMEERMTLCNLAGEFGARSALVAPDETTFEYLQGRRFAPTDEAWEVAVASWRGLRMEPTDEYDVSVSLSADAISPMVTWGTTPAMSVPIGGNVPTADMWDDPEQAARALTYMGLSGGEAITEIPVQKVFIGSCSNARLDDLRAAADVVRGRRVAPGVMAMVVPGSQRVKAAAEAEGLDEDFRAAGFQWRNSGCSMCLGMNDDRLLPGERCVATSNRNFEGRQGAGGRTHLASPEMAAAAALFGHFVDVREVRDEATPRKRR